MHVENINGKPFLVEIPKGKKVLAFGEHPGANPRVFFAFLCPENANPLPGSKIPNVEHFEGYLGKGEMDPDTFFNIEASRNEDGGYEFSMKLKGGTPWGFYKINPIGEKESSYDKKHAVEVFDFQS